MEGGKRLKDKKKKIMQFLISICLIIVLSIGFVKIKTKATITAEYSVEFNYRYSLNTPIAEQIIQGDSNVLITPSLPTYKNESQLGNVSFYLYGSDINEETKTFQSEDFINSKEINIIAHSGFHTHSFEIQDSNGKIVESSNTDDIEINNLEDGLYKVIYRGKGETFFNLALAQQYQIECTFKFQVDTIKPQLFGGSLSKTGKYTNDDFTITASDDKSLRGIYMKAPNETEFSLVGEKKTIRKENAVNGRYQFYALDQAGNQSSIYYVNFDNQAPTTEIFTIDGEKIEKDYTNQSFYFTAKDNNNLVKAEYRSPTDSTWQSYTLKTLIPANYTNGLYSFRAYDGSGNYSAIHSIYLDTIKPIGTIFGEDEALDNGGQTNAKYIQYVGKDEAGIEAVYVKKPQSNQYEQCLNEEKFFEDGTYYFYCVDLAGNLSTTQYVTLDHTAPVLKCEGGMFNNITHHIFEVSVEDAHSATLYYKSPSMQNFQQLNEPTFKTNINSQGGTYYFYAIDSFENKSDIQWIEFTKDPLPEAQIIRSEYDNSVVITWEGDFKALLNGEKIYEKGTWITQEGKYTLTLSSETSSRDYYFEINHYYIVKEEHRVSCTEEGYVVFQCVHCNDTYQGEFQEAIGHRFFEKRIEPTCTENGGIQKVCEQCGYSYMSEIIPAHGHEYQEYTVAPTCEKEGGIWSKCHYCGDVYYIEKIIPTGHSYQSQIVKEADCITEGERIHVCEYCQDTYTTVIPAYGHQYELIEEKKEGKILYKTYQCSVCQDTYVEEIRNEYQKVGNYIEYIFNEYQPYMVWIFIATSGIWSLAIGIAFIIAQKNEEKEKAKKMLINYLIGLIVIFSILVACPYLIRGISILLS